MKRWSDAKLAKELAFATGFDIPGAEAARWLQRLEAEYRRRTEDRPTAD